MSPGSRILNKAEHAGGAEIKRIVQLLKSLKIVNMLPAAESSMNNFSLRKLRLTQTARLC